MGFITFVLILLALFPAFWAHTVEYAGLEIHTAARIADTDSNYICATLDWWPSDKCNYDHCPWGFASVLNLDLSHPFLANAIQAFKHLRLRLGGSLQDQVLYDVGNMNFPCHQFRKQEDGLFGFSHGCLHMDRWDELNRFFKKTGALVTFGLNALHGRRHVNKQWEGKWDSRNAHDFINYTVSKGYQIDSWEFGNELSGTGIGASVDADIYGKDAINLNAIIDQLYKKIHPKPLLLAPGGFFDKEWFGKLLDVSGPFTVNALTHHIYNLGPGSDNNLVNKILNPELLNGISDTFHDLTLTIQTKGPWASAWVGESGGAFNSGGYDVSNAFVNSFWYLDQLGMAAKYRTKVYCRQTLIGGNYGLLDKDSFVPNPDYYSALLWHKLMGRGVLAVKGAASPYLRSYAHCTKERVGVTLLLINLSSQTEFKIGIRSVGEALSLEEYHLTPKDGNLRSRTVLLNGTPLRLTKDGDIPNLFPARRNANSPISIAPLSIKFIVFPKLNAPGCR